jgi:hypothetical protein
MAIQLFDADNNQLIGEISEAQLAFLEGQMEEESSEDRDYYISADTMDMLADDGADAALLALLKQAMAGREDITIKWVKS